MKKNNQNYANHRRMVPGFHYFTYSLILFLIIAAFMVYAETGNMMALLILLANGIALSATAFYARYFALKAQDRAIRAEENFRHFMLTGKPLSSGLRPGQIVALRFASDEELVELANRAEKENLKADEIKRAIKNWRGDYYRV